MAHGIDTAVHTMQASGADAAQHGSVREACLSKLTNRDSAVLPPSQSRN
jgi:hypothetical protein